MLTNTKCFWYWLLFSNSMRTWTYARFYEWLVYQWALIACIHKQNDTFEIGVRTDCGRNCWWPAVFFNCCPTIWTQFNGIKNHCIGLLSLSWFRCLSVSLLFLWQCMHKCLPISFQGVFMNPIAPSFRWFYWSKMPLMNIFKMPTHYVNWIISAYSYMLKANTFINKFQLEPSHSPPFISEIPHSFELFEWIVLFWKLSVTKTSSG